MPFYARVNDSLNRSQAALQQLRSYNPSAPARSEPNKSIRDFARQTITPAFHELQQGVREGRWEGVPGYKARYALQAADLITRATYSLSDRSDTGPANIPLAQSQIHQAIQLLHNARW